MPKIIYLFISLVVFLVACGGEVGKTAVSSTLEEKPAAEVQEETAETMPSQPLDTAVLDVCDLLPTETITAIVGDLREAPEAAVAIGEERGCTYLTDEGFVYTVFFVPLDRWEIAQAVLQNQTAVPNLGDKAFFVEQSGDTNLYILLAGRTMVQIYNTTSDTAVSTQLAQLAIETVDALQQ